MKLTSKFALLYLACVAAPLAGFSWLAFDSSRDAIGEAMYAATASSAHEGMEQFTRLVAGAGNDIDEWALLQEMQDVVIGDIRKALHRQLTQRLEIRPLFRALVALDADGRVVARAGRTGGMQWRESPAFRHSQGGRRFNSGVVNDAAAEPVMILSAPIRASQDQSVIVGVLVGVVEWASVQQRLSALSLMGHAQDARHRFVLVSNTDDRLLYDTLGTGEGVTALPRESGYRTLDVNGERYFVATTHPRLARIDGDTADQRSAWTLHALFSADIAYGRVEQLGERFLLIGVFVLAVATISMIMALHALLRPLVALARASDRLAENDFDCPLPATGSDEVGGLARSFARMRDAVAQHNAKLEAEVCERRNAEQRALGAQQEAQDASRAKSRFLAAMSHEIRTPINGVLGMADLLLKGELRPQQRRFAQNIERSGEVLLGVVNDILDLSRIEAGRFELDEAPFDLHSTLEDAVEMLAESAERKGLELGCVIPPDLPTNVRGDVLRLRQVLTNLIGNAVKFTETGEVTLRAEFQGEQNGRLTLRFEVHDTGIGLKPDALERVFDAFSQADASTTRRFGGTGLGLSICRHLVELMGGEIGVQSHLGEGSVFWFNVPMQRSEATPVSAEDHALAGLRVLLVDDNATNREILSHQLADLGAEHAAAASGEEALETLLQATRRGDPFDAAVIDHQMPGMSGIDLARAVRAQDALTDVALVLLSSIGGSGDDDWRALGVASRITKPIRRMELRQCLASACRHVQTGPPPESADTSAARRTLDGRRVLLAEDHPVNREVQIAMLQLLGCEVTIAEDGRLALDALQRESYDLVLMDCDMPVMDGFEAIAELRRIERETAAARTVVVALTANSLEGDRERCLQAGMDDYLSKPVVTDTLRDMLLRWIPATPIILNDPPTPPAAVADTAAVSLNTESPPLDQRVIEGIRATGYDRAPQLLRELAARYALNFERDTSALRDALAGGDLEAARKLAHRLKSSSATLGACALAARCQTIESAAMAGAIAAGDAAVDALYTEYQRVQQALDDECRRVA